MRLLLAAVLIPALAGCQDPLGVDGSGGEGGKNDGPQDSVLEGKLSTNGLDLRTEAMDLITTAPLARESEAGLVFAEDNHPGLLDVISDDVVYGTDRSGVELLEYLVRCALDDGEELWVDSLGASFAGHMGIAPQWATESCDESCQRWMTACVLAHTNPEEQPVTISLRGAHPALHWTEEHIAEFDFQEAAFYGNLFVPADERLLLACAGEGPLAEFERDALGGALGLIPMMNEFDGRVCASGVACNFQLSGLCQGTTDFVFGFPVEACTDLVGENGYYTGCDNALELLSPIPPSAEVITVYFQSPE
jgi:hypothetical protein